MKIESKSLRFLSSVRLSFSVTAVGKTSSLIDCQIKIDHCCLIFTLLGLGKLHKAGEFNFD